MLHTGNIDANGISIHYAWDGPDNAPWVVLASSVLMNLSVWDDQLPALVDDFRVLRFDMRGQGRSTVGSEPVTIDTLVDDTIGLLDAIGIESAAFVGLSLGANMSLRLAQRHPERISRLVTSSGNVVNTAAEAWERRIETARDHGMDALVEPTVNRWFHPDSLHTIPKTVERVRTMIRTTPVEGFAAGARVFQNYDIREGLSEVTMPILLISGEADGATPMAQAERHARMSQVLSGARCEVVSDVGHMVTVEAPDTYNALMRGFLEEGR